MTPDQVETAVAKRWLELWPTKQPTVPALLGDTVIAQPSGYFARCYVIDLDSMQSTIAGRGRKKKWQRDAMIEVRLYGPNGEGPRPLKALAQSVIEIFEGKRFGKPTANDFGIVTHASSLANLRRDRESPDLAMLSVTTPFEYFDRHT